MTAKTATNFYPCSRCEGKGRIEYYSHVKAGICFKCGGSGVQKTKLTRPSPKWAVHVVRIEDNAECLVFSVSAKTEAEAIKKASATLAKARTRVYDPATIRVTLCQ